MSLRIDIITIFPAYFEALNLSIIGRAQQKGSVKINIINLRDFSQDKHNKVDDKPFGGGPGMLMMASPIFSAVESVKTDKSTVIFATPQGEPFSQNLACEFAKNEEHLILICGHYEGVDERVLQLVDREISLGDYILTNGNLAAMVISDAVIRLLPEVLGDEKSLLYESFTSGLLEYPQYTKPVDFRGMKVPSLLLSGNHHCIEQWRQKQAMMKTKIKRPDLILDNEGEFTDEKGI